MMVLVIGGSGSGKSAYAEACMETLSKGKRKYYLAAMKVYDKEGEKKVARHRQLRKGKGFVTIEQKIDIERALEKMEDGEKTALLECVLNLTANEMFSENGIQSEASVAEKVVDGILALRMGLTHLVVVSGNVFEDGTRYDEATMAYIRAVGKIHGSLAERAEKVVEVVAGIPVIVKGS